MSKSKLLIISKLDKNNKYIACQNFNLYFIKY